MGWRLAPALAQRTLLFILKQAKITSGHVWIDNVILFGQLVQELQLELDRLVQLFAKYSMSYRVEIPITSQLTDYLGMDLDLDAGSFAFSKNFQQKFHTYCSDLLVSDKPLHPVVGGPKGGRPGSLGILPQPQSIVPDQAIAPASGIHVQP